MDLFRRKSVTALQAEALTDHSLKRALGALNLTMLGLGAIIGTGIFVLTGTVGALAAARGTPLIEVPGGGWKAVTDALLQSLAARGVDPNTLPHVTAVFNLPAVIIIAIVTTLLVIGIKESANVNNVIVFVKVAVVLLFIAGATHAINPVNWHPFIPPNTGTRGEFG